MAHPHQKEQPRLTAFWAKEGDGTAHGEGIGFSEHVVRILVLGLAAAYTYLLLG